MVGGRPSPGSRDEPSGLAAENGVRASETGEWIDAPCDGTWVALCEAE